MESMISHGRAAAIIVGDSHYAALASAAESTIPVCQDIEAEVELLIFNAWRHGLNYQFTVAEGSRWLLNPEMKQQFECISQRFDECVIFMLFGGGHHSALTILRHPRPFDFILPQEPNLPLEEGAEILPAALVSDLLSDMVAVPLRTMKCIKEAFPHLKCFQIESPPPNGDDGFVLNNLGEWFHKSFSPDRLADVAPRLLRYKMWRLHSLVVEEQCRKYGIVFEHLPPNSMIEGRYLKPIYYGNDSTHASPAYGRLVLDQIEGRLDAKFERWSVFG